jgi:hypothetical protein
MSIWSTQNHFKNNITNVFQYLKDFKKDLKSFENNIFMGNHLFM